MRQSRFMAERITGVLREQEAEHARRKTLVADAMLDSAMLNDMASKKC